MTDETELDLFAQSAPAPSPTRRRRAPVRNESDDAEELARLRALRRQDPRNDALRFKVAHLASRLEGS